MATVQNTYGLVKALEAEGFPLPEMCREARVILGVDNAFMIQYDVFLTLETTAKLGRALQRLGDESRDTRGVKFAKGDFGPPAPPPDSDDSGIR